MLDDPTISASSALLIGVSSWSDRSLTQDSKWYPRKTMKAAERMSFYADQFPLVEMETAYRFPPTVAATEQWVERTPAGFKFDIPAWSLLTGQPTYPPSLYEDLAQEVRTDRRDRVRLYSSHLSSAALDECWSRFVHSLTPLQAADKLGTVLLKFPRWMKPGDTSRRFLEQLRYRLGDLPAAIEMPNAAWFDSEECETTFNLLEDLDFALVCVDAPDGHPRSMSGAEATTSGKSVLRLLGRRQRPEEDEWREDYRSYRYTDEDWADLIPRIEHLAQGCDELHILFSTCWRDDAVLNAQDLQRHLTGSARMAG